MSDKKDNIEDDNVKTFSVKHGKSDGLLNIDDEHLWCMIGDKTVYDISRVSIRFCTLGRKGMLIINRESDDGITIKTLSIRSKYAGAIRDALLL